MWENKTPNFKASRKAFGKLKFKNGIRGRFGFKIAVSLQFSVCGQIQVSIIYITIYHMFVTFNVILNMI